MSQLSISILPLLSYAQEHKYSTKQLVQLMNQQLYMRAKDFDRLHLDIMDGMFVAEKSFTLAQLQHVFTTKPVDAHFMVKNYPEYIKKFFHHAQTFIVHQEVLRKDFDKTITFLHQHNKQVGVAINPQTPISAITHLNRIDTVLLMSVHPGRSGQEFIDATTNKIKALKTIRKKQKLTFTIAIDGGINERTGKRAIRAGADIIVSGSWFFSEKYTRITTRK